MRPTRKFWRKMDRKLEGTYYQAKANGLYPEKKLTPEEQEETQKHAWGAK